MDWSNVFNMGLLQNTLRTATPVKWWAWAA